MAAQLIGDMTGRWNATDYTDRFTDAVHALVNRKVEAGQTERVTPLEGAAPEGGASNVVDLTELLARSLAKRKPAVSKPAGPDPLAAKPEAAKRAARKRA